MSKSLIGKIVAKLAKQTAKIAIETDKFHPLYKKQRRVTHKFLVHDPTDATKVGQVVEIVQSRPISKNKHWVIVSKESKTR